MYTLYVGCSVVVQMNVQVVKSAEGGSGQLFMSLYCGTVQILVG